MVDGHLLNKLNEIAKNLRRNNRPFGGIQLVACGDFYQLPPVVKKTAHDGTELDDVEVFLPLNRRLGRKLFSELLH